MKTNEKQKLTASIRNHMRWKSMSHSNDTDPLGSAVLYLFLVNICCCWSAGCCQKILNNDRRPRPPPREVDANVGLPAVDLGESERRDVAPDFQRLSKDTPDLLLAHLPGEPHDPAREQYRCQNTYAACAVAEEDHQHRSPPSHLISPSSHQQTGGLLAIPSGSLTKHHIVLSSFFPWVKTTLWDNGWGNVILLTGYTTVHVCMCRYCCVSSCLCARFEGAGVRVALVSVFNNVNHHIYMFLMESNALSHILETVIGRNH